MEKTSKSNGILTCLNCAIDCMKDTFSFCYSSFFSSSQRIFIVLSPPKMITLSVIAEKEHKFDSLFDRQNKIYWILNSLFGSFLCGLFVVFLCAVQWMSKRKSFVRLFAKNSFDANG